MPFLYGLLDWKLVSPERRRQLRQATEKQVKLADQAYQHMQQEYKVMHQVLFRFMTTFTGVETRIARYAELVEPQLDSQSTALLADLCERGRSLFEQATTHARTMLLEHGNLHLTLQKRTPVPLLRLLSHRRILLSDVFDMA